MGMDLYSTQKKQGKHLHYRFNWGGWGKVCVFLESLECDLSRFSGSNDGDVVPASHCKAIAKKIRNAWENDQLVESYSIRKDSSLKYHYLSVNVTTISDNSHKVRVSPYTGETTKKDWLVRVNPHTGEITKNDRYGYPNSLKVLKCPVKKLPLLLPEFQDLDRLWSGFFGRPIEIDIIEARLKGVKPDLSKGVPVPDIKTFDTESPDFNPSLKPFNPIRYYLGFMKFCEECSHLGGFEQH